MLISRYKKGIIIGIIVGILSVPLALLGLGSTIGLIFYPLILIPRSITLLVFGPSMPLLVIVSILVYGLLGLLIQYLYEQIRG